jgi:hypothetical protein
MYWWQDLLEGEYQMGRIRIWTEGEVVHLHVSLGVHVIESVVLTTISILLLLILRTASLRLGIHLPGPFALLLPLLVITLVMLAMLLCFHLQGLADYRRMLTQLRIQNASLFSVPDRAPDIEGEP